MNRMLISLLVGLALVAAPAGAAIITVDGGGGANYSTIQAAIDAAADGDIIQVADGTYAESLNVYKPLSIFGASEAGTIIDASGFNDYAIDASSNDPVAFAFADFTLIGNPAYTTAFGLKVSGDDVTVDVQRVTVQGCYRTGLNFNGLAGGVVTDCTATGTVYGVGLGMANCSNMTVSGLTTSGNAWAGMAVYADGTYYTGGSDNVVLTGTNTFGEPVALYTEEADGFFVTNFQVSTADFGALTGNNMNPAAVAYVPTVALAQTGVLGTDPVNGWVIDRADGSFAVAAGMSIQAAIDAASPGDVINVTAGTYTEALTVNKHVSIIGAGSAAGTGTVITQTAAGAGDSQIGVVNLAASGASALDPILLRSLRIEPVGISGLNVGRFTQATGTMVAFVALDDVAVVGTNLNPGSEQERGLYVDLTSSLTNLDITDCAFNNLAYGWYTQKQVSADASNVQFVTCSNSTFNHNNMKGLYAEKLSDATFTGCTVSGNGFDPAGIPSYFLPWMSGVDVNLKAGTYQNLVFSGCTVTSNGLGGAQHGVGLTAKARGTGTLDTGYAAYPATLDNVQVIDCIVTGNERGIRFGEPGKDNTTPTNVVVSGCTLAGNVQTYAGSDGSAYGDVVNVSTAPVNAGFNWWGDTDATDQVGGTGAVAISPWLGAAPGTSPMAWYVDTTGTIQAAIDAAVAGDDIYVSAGHFEEQLHVTKDDLAITGAGAGATFVDCPPVLALAYTTSVANKPVVFVDGCTGVALSGLTVDGLGRGNANYRFQGIGFWNAGGSVTNAHVTNIMDTPFSGSQHGVGIYAYNVTGGPYTIAVTDVLVDAFQKGGVVVNGAGEHGIFTRVTTPGAGPTGVTAQNGIQVGYGATGAVIDCTVSDVVYTGSNWGATGVLIYDAGPVTVSGTNIDASQAAISYSYGGGSVTGGALTGCTTVGVELWNSYAKADAGRIRPAPVAEDAHRADKAAQSVTITNVPMTANGGTAGVWVTADDPAAVSVTGSSITGFEYGMILDEVLPGAIGGSATGNVIAANTNFGAWSNTATPFDARGNDWGTASGPFHATLNPAGQGNAVSDNVLFEPWTGQAGLSVSPVATGPLSCGQSVDLTFSYTADASTPDMFLYNIVVAIPAELTYAGSTDDEPFGDSNKYFYDIDNGDGTRTITGSTVGNPTNPVSGAGTVPLFTLHLTTAGDGTASVGAQSFVFRDPTNQPIAAGASGATVTVDCTAPAAVTAIAAAPGHNKIDLTWSHDGNDVDHYEVFAGLWHDGAHASAYPEYDDMPADALPVREGSYAATAASADWLSVGTPGTPGFTQAWTDALNRGVYYYEVFAIDAAGNASPASASIDRATNYWLGDVYGLTDATPNGVVNAFDVNELGSAFGTAVPYGAATNVLDVGPTDDWSRLGVPLTDNVINFEDLIIFTMNFGVVSAAKDRAPMDDHVALSWVDYGDGRYGLRLVDGASLKGLRVQAPGAVDNVTAGALLDEQSELTFLRNVGATLDASVAVFGGGVAFTGSGDLMVIEAGDAIDVADLVITARATDNSALMVTVDKTSDAMAPRVFALHPNYPNPFNPTTKISFSLPEAQSVRLAIYSVDGRRVATLVNEVRTAGLHEVLWKGQDDAGRPMASGVYFCRIDAGPYSSVHKMMLAK